MAGEILLVSVVLWAAILVIYILLDRRLASLTRMVAILERQRGKS